MGAQSGGELGHCRIARDAAEFAFGLQYPGGGPAEHHGAAIPTLDAVGYAAHPAK